ncbi:cysteine hydrolase [Baekduia soli]|uniref:Cysteine hydrolase n=1 Tax=Baekduia soli TaxID=496014 RepID=A0A5B8U2T8_9ACTN|nr:isochorismatase family cysteine hydrolase [Baekduia soli]QEC47280.1 cysteine hydrolase [Baekduia soli]
MSTTPYGEATWDLVPGHTALVLIDLQNDFLHPEGWYATSGVDISHMRRVIEPTRELVAAARAAGVPVVWTRHGFREETAGTFPTLRPFLRDGGLRQDTWGYEICEELRADGFEDGDFLCHKSRLSGFYLTDLELILRGLHAETVLYGGVLTNQCVAATSKDSNFRDFKTIVVEEATGTTMPHLHDPAIEMMRVGWCQVSALADMTAQLQAMTAPAVT